NGMICGAGFRHTSLSSLPGVSPPASSASSGETLLAANTTFRLSGTLAQGCLAKLFEAFDQRIVKNGSGGPDPFSNPIR
ncbi:MAG: hypothetical protein IKS21_06250, partial [Oscillospiraceae bacterium]|nr:hypothetical protein [Oscillospiraceae bacterium]